MTTRTQRFLAAMIATWAAGATVVAAANAIEAGISIGYANLTLDDAEGRLDGHGGFRMEPRLTWRPFERLPELGIGFGVGVSFYHKEFDAPPTSVPFFGIVPNSGFEELTLIVPELQISWKTPLSERWSLEGGVGVGGAFADYSAGDIIVDNFIRTSYGDEDSALSVHPFVRAGYGRDNWTVGIDAGYLWTDIEFGPPVGSGLSEWHVGLFASYRN